MGIGTGLGLLTLVCSFMLGTPLELSWWVLGMSMWFFVVFVVVKMAKKTTSGSCLNMREVVVVAGTSKRSKITPLACV